MKLLLDTHTFIWWVNEPEKLSPKALSLLSDRGNDLVLSVVSAWEMQIKVQLGRLKLTVPLGELIETQVRANGLRILPVELEHVLALQTLPAHHKDPFDRLLIAQANAEGAALVSRDALLASYPVKSLW